MANKGGFDLYKTIIIVSLLLLPVAGGGLYWLEQQITTGKRAIADAQRPRTGQLPTIARLVNEIETLVKNAGRTATEVDPTVYFEREIGTSAKQTLRRTDFRIDQINTVKHPETASIDRQIKVDFLRDGKKFALPRDLVQAILFNIEARSPAWRLRSLNLRNEDTGGTKQLRTSGEKPNGEIADNWFVDTMVFARREPDPDAKRK
jgi:hypothetical protein